MAHNEQSAGSGCALGLDWNATNTDGGTYKLAPTLWRYDSSSTDNYGSSWSEYLYYEPSGSTGHWTGGWGSGSGWRKYDSFSTRTYTKKHSSYTVKITINTDSEFGTWNGGWVTLGSKYFAWTITIPARTSYAVSFNANGGSGAPSSQTKWYGESLTLSSTTPTRTGYTFNGWNTKSDGSGTNYAKGASYTGNAALTLYAKWTINTWTVSYNGNGSTGGSTASQTKTYNTALTLRSNGFTKTNHVFKNWNTAANGSGTSYAAGASYTGNAALTLYAQWYAPYTISYNANGGSGAPASQTKIYNSTLTLSSSTPTRANYNFIGWNTNEAGTGTSYSPGGSYTANAAATLYAVWEIAHANPTITNLLVRRCLSDGTPDNQGTNVLIEADWSVDTSTEGFEDTVGYQCRITLDNKVDTISLSGTSGHISRVHQSNGANTDILLTNKYPVTLAVEDSHNFVASRFSTVSISFFTVHYKAGGTGIGIGKATNRDALDVGMEAYFDQAVHVGGNLDGKILTADNKLIVKANTDNYGAINFESANNAGDIIRFYGGNDQYGDGVVIGQGGTVVIGSGESAPAIYSGEGLAGGTEATYIGSDGAVYIVTGANTYSSKVVTQITSTGVLLTVGDYERKRTELDISSTIAADKGYWIASLCDANGRAAGRLQAGQYAAGKTYCQMVARRYNDSANVDNAITCYVDANGTRSYAVSDAAAFRSAIGLGADKAWTAGLSGTAFYIKRGRFVSVWASGNLTTEKKISSSYTTLFTLPSGYRPMTNEIHGCANGYGSDADCCYKILTGGAVQVYSSSSSNKYWCFFVTFPVA